MTPSAKPQIQKRSARGSRTPATGGEVRPRMQAGFWVLDLRGTSDSFNSSNISLWE